MKNSFDTKSALLGLCLGVLAVVAVGAGKTTHPIGRFQITGTAANCVMVDTATGEAWTVYLSPNGGHSDTTFFKAKLNEEK